MADVASREGLIQVMRDMLAAPEQFDWLATRLEIARKLRNDPEFSRGWAERSAELAAATPIGCDGRRRHTGCARTFPATCCSATWNWSWTDWWPGWHPAKIRSDWRRPRPGGEFGAPQRFWSCVRRAVGPAGLAARRVVGAAAAAHRGTRLAQHAVNRPVRPAGVGQPASGCLLRPRRRCATRATSRRASFSTFASSAPPRLTRTQAHRVRTPARVAGQFGRIRLRQLSELKPAR